MKKIHACQLALKNIHARKIITKKTQAPRKFPTPTPIIANGPSQCRAKGLA